MGKQSKRKAEEAMQFLLEQQINGLDIYKSMK